MHVKLGEVSNYFVGPNKWCISLLNDHINVGNRFEVYIYFTQYNESNLLSRHRKEKNEGTFTTGHGLLRPHQETARW